MWRSTVFECVHHEAKLLLCFLIGQADSFKYLLLYVAAMDTDGTAADFGAVQNHIISLSIYLAGVGQQQIDRLKARGVGTTIVDGALSRLSLASPAVTEAMILATGAAVAGNIPELVRKTKYVYELIGIEEIEEALRTRLDPLTQGVWAVSDGGEPIDLELPSVLMLERSGENLFRHGRRIYATGIVTDKLFQLLRTQQREVELIVRDFTRVFASPEAFYAFLRRGHRIRVVHRSRLLAVTVNPTAPSGLVLDSRRLCEAMQEALQIPVYDVKKMPE